MRRSDLLRLAAVAAMAAVAGLGGCTHNHYYGAPPVYAQPADITTIHYNEGTVCEAPAAGNGTVVVAAPARPAVVGSGAGSTRVVVSTPTGAPRTSSSRFAWHKPDPENLATTRVEGALDEDSRVR